MRRIFELTFRTVIPSHRRRTTLRNVSSKTYQFVKLLYKRPGSKIHVIVSTFFFELFLPRKAPIVKIKDFFFTNWL